MSSLENVPTKRKLQIPDEQSDVKRSKIDLESSENFASQPNPPCAIIECPVEGAPVNRREFRHIGPYILGPKLGSSAIESISQYLAKKENSDEFVQLKILHLLNGDTSNKIAVSNERQAKNLLHTEFSLLTLLESEGISGVIKQHGLFSDIAYEEDNGVSNKSIPRYTGKLRKRLVFVLDCVSSHDYCKRSHAYVNLQQYLAKEKKLPEIQALHIFYEIISVVENLHKKNVIHRDLKLGNVVLNKSSNKIIITNFCLGKHLLNENNLLYDQRGSPAYISPDVLCGPPYKGKPSDIWALGVVLFMMFCGRFPFYETTPSALFRKIRAADYTIPSDVELSPASQILIQEILVLQPDARLNATQIREKVQQIIFVRPQMLLSDQLVPTLPLDETNKYKVKTLVQSNRRTPSYFKSDQLVPQLETETSKCSLTKSCSVPLTPISQSFLRPSSRLQLQSNSHPVRSVTQNDIGQVQFIVFNNSARNGNSTNNNNDSSNWQTTIPLPNNGSNSQLVTQQMSNLSLRNRRELGLSALSWHDLVRNDTSTSSESVNNNDDNNTLRRLQFDPDRPSSIQQAIDSLLPDDHIRFLLNLFNRMLNDNDTQASLPLNLSESQSPSPQLVPNATSTDQQISITNFEFHEIILQAINTSLLQQNPQPTRPLIEFNGTITQDLATKICLWFITNYGRRPIVQQVFNDNSDNAIVKVRDFLTICGVQTLNVDGFVQIKRNQKVEVLLVIIYLLQATGYTHRYLLN